MFSGESSCSLIGTYSTIYIQLHSIMLPLGLLRPRMELGQSFVLDNFISQQSQHGENFSSIHKTEFLLSNTKTILLTHIYIYSHSPVSLHFQSKQLSFTYWLVEAENMSSARLGDHDAFGIQNILFLSLFGLSLFSPRIILIVFLKLHPNLLFLYFHQIPNHIYIASTNL